MPIGDTAQSDDLMRLGQAARAAGISVNQLQYYLYMQVVEPGHRSRSGQRLFDARDLKRIRMVKLLNDSGYPLREIREIFMEKRQTKRRRDQEIK